MRKSLGDLLFLRLRLKRSFSHDGPGTGRQSKSMHETHLTELPIGREKTLIHEWITEKPPLQRLMPLDVSRPGGASEKCCTLSLSVFISSANNVNAQKTLFLNGLIAHKPHNDPAAALYSRVFEGWHLF